MTTFHVYTVWQDRTPIYVGCTNDVERRLKEHARSARRWNASPYRVEVFDFDSQAMALTAERDRIQKLRPLTNLRDNPRYIDLLDRMYTDVYPADLLDKLVADRRRICDERQREWHEARGYTYTPWPAA